MTKNQKVIILAIQYNEENEVKLKPILEEMKTVALKINTEVGEIWKPYEGKLNRVYGLLDDLILLNLSPEERENPNDLVKKILLKRCEGVQSFLKTINKTTDKDLAYSVSTHVNSCSNCQPFVWRNFGIGGNRDLQLFIQRKLRGEKFDRL